MMTIITRCAKHNNWVPTLEVKFTLKSQMLKVHTFVARTKSEVFAQSPLKYYFNRVVQMMAISPAADIR